MGSERSLNMRLSLRLEAIEAHKHKHQQWLPCTLLPPRYSSLPQVIIVRAPLLPPYGLPVEPQGNALGDLLVLKLYPTLSEVLALESWRVDSSVDSSVESSVESSSCIRPMHSSGGGGRSNRGLCGRGRLDISKPDISLALHSSQ